MILGVVPDAERVGYPFQRQPIRAALHIEQVQLTTRVQGGGKGDETGRERLAHPRHGTDQARGEHEVQRHGTPSGVGAERERLEHVHSAFGGQGPGLGGGLVQQLVTHPQHEPSGVGVGVAFGPHAPDGAAQARGKPVATFSDVPGSHARG